MREIHVIVDLGYGSSGKGLFAGYLAKRLRPDTIITAWGPNAGHTFVDAAGNKSVHIALPNGVVSDSLRRILLGPGSVINPQLLEHEMALYPDLFKVCDLRIHECAAIVTEAHRAQESDYAFKIGSTMKGVGAAITQKIRRDPDAQNIAAVSLRGTPLEKYVTTHADYANFVRESRTILIEGSQGFSLSINHGFYPYVTSRDCTTQQVLAECAIPYGVQQDSVVRVYGVTRTYPIRVANRYKDGEMVGWSGPCYVDQNEIEWSDLGIAPELTTVTKLPRRVFTLSLTQLREAIKENGVQDIFLNFANYVKSEEQLREMVMHINRVSHARVIWLGYGPREDQIVRVAV